LRKRAQKNRNAIKGKTVAKAGVANNHVHASSLAGDKTIEFTNGVAAEICAHLILNKRVAFDMSPRHRRALQIWRWCRIRIIRISAQGQALIDECKVDVVLNGCTPKSEVVRSSAGPLALRAQLGDAY
jgi:hypothetical protein